MDALLVSVSSFPCLYQLLFFGISASLASGKVRLVPGLVVAKNVLALHIPAVIEVI